MGVAKIDVRLIIVWCRQYKNPSVCSCSFSYMPYQDFKATKLALPLNKTIIRDRGEGDWGLATIFDLYVIEKWSAMTWEYFLMMVMVENNAYLNFFNPVSIPALEIRS